MKNFISKNLGKISGAVALVGSGISALAVGAEVPTASSTLDSIMTVIISTTVSMVTMVFTNYWGYVLIVGVIVGFVGLFKKLVSAGHK